MITAIIVIIISSISISINDNISSVGAPGRAALDAGILESGRLEQGNRRMTFEAPPDPFIW